MSFESDFVGRVAVISGAASGIGLATAERFARSGVKLLLWDRSDAGLQRAAESLKLPDGNLTLRQLDVTDEADVQRAAAEAHREYGRIDILIASAGITGPNATAWEYPSEAWREVMSVNLDGVYHCCKAIVPYMRDAGYGRIVNVASIGGKEGNALASAYAASKAAVIAFTKALGKELVDVDVRANSICPAALETDLLKQMEPEFVQGLLAKIPLGRFGTASEVAGLIAWMSSAECSFCTGAVFDSSGGRATY